MTPEAQNIAIAESLGYKAVKDKSGHWDLTHPKVSVEKSGWFLRKDAFLAAPNYHASLDACAEFEAKLTDGQQYEYQNALIALHKYWQNTPVGFGFRITSSTAPQRCEAYLRTLNLWKESK